MTATELKKATLQRPGLKEPSKIDTATFHAVRLVLSNGGIIEIELFERTEGAITIRTIPGDGKNCIAVYPQAGNTIEISTF